MSAETTVQKMIQDYVRHISRSGDAYKHLATFFKLYQKEIEKRLLDASDVVGEIYPSDFEQVTRDLLKEAVWDNDKLLEVLGGVEKFRQEHDADGSYSEYILKEEMGLNPENADDELRTRAVLHDVVMSEFDRLSAEISFPDIFSSEELEEDFPSL